MHTLSTKIGAFARELKQRRVYQTAALYAASAFIILQAADLLIDGLNLPAWLLTFLIVLAILGLPVALVLAWIFDVTRTAVRPADAEPVARPPATRGRMAIAAIVLVLIGAASYGAYVRVVEAPAQTIPTIAVLPFADLGGGGEDEYLRDGLTEDVLTQLAKASGLRVISRTSVMQYRGSTKTIPAIAAELGATHVLEGSVRRSGERLRVSAQLIEASNDQHLWAETYDRRAEDVLDLQSDIAQRIAAALRVRLTAAERERIRSVSTGEPRAYDLYLRARQYTYRYEREANEIAIELARKALDIDPEFAPAHALLGAAFAFKVRVGDGPEWGDSGMVAAQRAITLDPQLAEGHMSLGNAHARQGRYAEALRSFRRAAELNPSDWRAAVNMAVVYSYQGEQVEALRWTRRAIRMDPQSPLIGVAYQNLSTYYLNLSLPDQAAAALAKAHASQPGEHPQLRMLDVSVALLRGDHGLAIRLADALAADAPTDASVLLIAGDAHLFGSDLQGARLHYERAYALSPHAEGIRHYAPVLLGYVLWQQGEVERAERILGEFESMAREEISKGHDNYTVFLGLAATSAIRRDTRAALKHLERAAASAGVVVEWTLAHDPLLAAARREPGYRALQAELRARGDALRRQVVREDL